MISDGVMGSERSDPVYPNESQLSDLLSEYRSLEVHLADPSTYADPVELRRVSDRFEQLEPIVIAST